MSLIWTNFMINPTKTNMHACWALTEFPRLMNWAVSHWSRIRFPLDSPWQGIWLYVWTIPHVSSVAPCSLAALKSSLLIHSHLKHFLTWSALGLGRWISSLMSLFSWWSHLVSWLRLEWSKHHKLKISIANRNQIHLANSLFNSSTWFSNWHLISEFFKWSSCKYHIPSILTL